MIEPNSVVAEALEESARVKRAMMAMSADIVTVATEMARAFQAGNRLYACGNGGSACDAMHLVEELVARYRMERPGLPAHHLLDSPTLTCWANDYEFESAFARQVRTMGRAGDILVAISTSGNSPNVIAAAEAAAEARMATIALTGRDGGRLAPLCGRVLAVPATATERIQEGHITIIHLLCDLVERMLFGDLRHHLDDPSSTSR